MRLRLIGMDEKRVFFRTGRTIFARDFQSLESGSLKGC
jgi:hypothetical protein